MSDRPTDLVGVTVTGDIAVVAWNNPPVNALSSALRGAIHAAIEELTTKNGVRAIIVCGAGRGFSAGADIRDLSGASKEPTLPQVVGMIESLNIPVIAALHGPVLGGGLELALGAHYRVADASASLGLPEIKLGLIPGAGGTQRLPRLIGLKAALEMISTGEPVDARRALALGLIDESITGDLGAGALRFAQSLLAHPREPRRAPLPIHDANSPDDPRLLDAALADFSRRKPQLPAPLRVIDALRAAVTRPFEEGLAVERAAFLSLRDSPESMALRYAFTAEREAARAPASLGALEPIPLRTAVVIGAGTMGQGIAFNLAEAGLSVQLQDADHAALVRALQSIAGISESRVKRGRLSTIEADAIIARIKAVADLAECRDADLLIEAVFEDLDVKRTVFARADELMKPATLFATNTSYLDVDVLAGAIRRPQQVIGLHFFSPAHVMKLLEIVPGSATDPVVQATALALGKRLRKQTVLVGNARGFVGNRMLARRTREAYFLLEEGATPSQVDQAFTDFGFPMGPFAVGDLAGLDVGWRNRRAIYAQLTPREQQCTILDQLVEAGRLGQKAGRGFYRYDEKRRAEPDPEVEAMIVRHAAKIGRKPRSLAAEEILRRCLFAMIDEGARILGDGKARSSHDIDVVWLHGYGFPRHRGGPMYHADRLGLVVVRDAIMEYQEQFGPDYWSVAPLLAELAAAGSSFQAWSTGRSHDK